MTFPEALVDDFEFEQFRKEIDVPLLANMTEFGKTKILTSRYALWIAGKIRVRNLSI